MNRLFSPDLIFINGTVRTQDDEAPLSEALAVSNGRISAIGSTKQIKSLTDSKTKIIDLGGRLMLPGFTDTHFHFFDWVLNYDSIDLAKAFSFREMEIAVKEKVQKSPAGQWILGNGFNESDWPENKMPDRYDLDRLAPGNPVCIWRCDLHLAVANSRALHQANITSKTPDPPEGLIARDSSGEPTGVLREFAPNLIKNAVPPIPERKILEIMEKKIAHLHSLGITGIHDVRLMGGLDGADSLRAWQKMNEQNRLNIRCHVTLPGEMTDQAIALGLRTGMGDDRLRLGHLKFFADGGMGARTAWMTEKYLDAEYGMPLTPMEYLESALIRADAAGLSIMIHAIGTRANKELIAMFERFEKNHTINTRLPHRIEHLQMIEPEDIKKLGQLKHVAVSCQPNNLSLDISMIQQSVGEKGAYTYQLKSTVDLGIPLMLSSDAPVCNPNPLAGIFSAVNRTRMNHTPENGWYMDQALSVEEAVKGYTIVPAEASCINRDIGTISPGKFADLIVLEKDIYEIDPKEIADISVDLTVFNGELVYSRR